MKSMARITALVLNVVLLGFIFTQLLAHGMPDGDELAMVALLTSVPLLNLVVLLSAKTADSCGILRLYLQRKRLEEEAKIKSLKERIGDNNKSVPE